MLFYIFRPFSSRLLRMFLDVKLKLTLGFLKIQSMLPKYTLSWTKRIIMIKPRKSKGDRKGLF